LNSAQANLSLHLSKTNYTTAHFRFSLILTAMTHDLLFTRSAGVLMHISSLPSRYGIGDLGTSAYQFVDFLYAANQRIWQVLPLTPTGYGNSPYYSYSAMACNHLLISPDVLQKRGYLTEQDVAGVPDFPNDTVDFGAVIPAKMELLQRAFAHFQSGASVADRKAFEVFCETNKSWLENYVLFTALKTAKYGGQPWSAWEKDDRFCTPAAMQIAREKYKDTIELHTYLQYEFAVQWQELRHYATSKGVALVGDIPIFVAYDSADVWSNKGAFRLDKDGNPTVVAGVPPDYFSATGQLWGNPHYNWAVMEKDGFAWWEARFEKCFELYDIVRIDHFRAFEDFWEIPAGEKTAVKGKWVKAPGEKLFTAMQKRFGDAFSVIAEDLGEITPAVTELRKKFHLPGMKILQFGYETCNPSDAFMPHNFETDSVAYTGTHDNDTTLGWYRAASDAVKHNVHEYLYASSEEEVVWEMIRAATLSTALFAIIPMQDILTLGTEARMNLPGRAEGNWGYRLLPDQVQSAYVERLARYARLGNRLAPKPRKPH
jgi:4-alpha-glucanotransferase